MSIRTPRDENRVPALFGVSPIDSITPIEVYVDDTTHRVYTDALIKEASPTDSSKVNGSLVLAYDVDDNLSTITKTIDGVQYQKALTYSTGVLTGVSSWVEV